GSRRIRVVSRTALLSPPLSSPRCDGRIARRVERRRGRNPLSRVPSLMKEGEAQNHPEITYERRSSQNGPVTHLLVSQLDEPGRACDRGRQFVCFPLVVPPGFLRPRGQSLRRDIDLP